ncbi:MAG: S9 family peptidase, partial [Betaproteobacteria bacterium]|nr:S9 family peptidase [Betaproteobacteria bacterium]
DRLLFSVLDLAAGSGEDQRQGSGLFVVGSDGGGLRMLIQRDGGTGAFEASMRQPPLGPGHALMHIPERAASGNSSEIIVGRAGFRGSDLESITPLWLNVETGRTRSLELAGFNLAGAVRWWFDRSGQPRAAAGLVDGKQVQSWRHPQDGRWRELPREDAVRLRTAIHDIDEAGNLYVTQPVGAAGELALFRLDTATMKPASEPMVRTPGFDFNGQLVVADTDGRVLGVRVETDAEQTHWFDPALRDLQKAADLRFDGRVNRIDCRRCGARDMVALVMSYSDRDPGHLWLHDAQSGNWQHVSALLDGIDPQQMASVDFHRIRARDGRDLPVWITRPATAKPQQPLPAVVMVHGGPWVKGGSWRWRGMEQFLASRGYLVISPEFRGSIGYGSAHYEAGWRQWGQAMQDDVADALLWARQQGLANDRACIAGASYGGYSTLIGLVRHPELYRCGVAWVAVSDLPLLVKGSWFIVDDISRGGRQTLPRLVGDPDRDAVMLRENSPLEQAARIRAPLLLAYGEADLRVPLEHGQRLRAAMTAAGNPPTWISYPNEGHSWRKVATRVDFAKRVEQFLQTHLQANVAGR